MKKCPVCLLQKNNDEFYKSGKYLSAKCKECTKKHVNDYRIKNKDIVSKRKKDYRIANLETIKKKNKERYESKKEQIKASLRDYYNRNKDALNAASRLYYYKNRERMKECFAIWRSKNLSKKRDMNARRRAAKLKAIPSWANKSEIYKIYLKAQSMKDMHVDHIVPLQSKLVCGLHVENNLQIIPAVENSRKSNVVWPDMP